MKRVTSYGGAPLEKGDRVIRYVNAAGHDSVSLITLPERPPLPLAGEERAVYIKAEELL